MTSVPNPNIDSIARRYIAQNKGWAESEYTIRDSGRKDGSGNSIVTVVHRDDEKMTAPGGGKSVELRVDLPAGRVVKELRFQ